MIEYVCGMKEKREKNRAIDLEKNNFFFIYIISKEKDFLSKQTAQQIGFCLTGSIHTGHTMCIGYFSLQHHPKRINYTMMTTSIKVKL